MPISIEELKKTAELSRIYLSEERVTSMCEEINSMFEFVKQIEEVDIEGIKPMISTIEHNLPLRNDIVAAGNIANDIIKNAPASQENFFLVPKVVE